MDPEGSPADNNAEMTSRSGGSPPHTMKKGPWTSTEDAILMEHVKNHGEGNWNAVRRNTGLMRCGKSCRLRWTNHLRPNLKKGAFSSEEEALIVELHAKLGNKWSRMASLLPGRTDNEIKNYWNTRLKRRQRAGLPVYPPDTNPQNHHQQENPQTNLTSSSLVSLLSSRQGLESGYRTPISIFDMFSSPAPMSNSQNQIKSSYLSDPNQHFKIVHDKNGVALSLSSFNSPFPSISTSLAFNNQGIAPPGPPLSMPVNFINFGIENSAPVSQASLEQNGQNAIGSGSSMELPSIPSLVPEATTTPTSSGSDYVIAPTSDADDHDETHGQGLLHGNSGLFDDLADESQALTHSEKEKEISLDIDRSQGKFLWDYRLTEDADGSGRDESGLNVILDQQYEESFPGHSIIRTKTTNTSSLESNPLDDDFLSLLDMSDWCDGNGNNTNRHSSNSNGGEGGMENDQPGPSYSPDGATSEKTNNSWAAGASCWENMPGNY